MVDKGIIIAEIERLKADYVPRVNEEYRDFANLLLDIVVDSINSIPAEQSGSKEFKEEFEHYCVHGDIRNPYFEGPFGYDDIRKTAIHFNNWQKEQIINKACEWLRRCVDVDDKVKMIDGEPEALSFIEKAKHRIEVANQVVEDFKKVMEQ